MHRNGTTQAQIQGQYYWGSRPVAFYTNGATHFQHQDWLGTERVRTTYNGASEGTFTSLPFGDGLDTASGTDTDAYHFAMLDHDYQSDTEHAQFRQYNSAQGHWMRPDPYYGSCDLFNPQSFNRYAYALNNPLSTVDPTGLDQYFWADGFLWYSYTTIVVTSASDGDVTFSTYVNQSLVSCGTDDGSNPGGSNGGNAVGGGGGSSGGSTPSQLKSAYCSAVPSGRSTSVNVAFGGIGSVSGGVDMVVNYNSGQTSLFATGGGTVGWNGGLSLTAPTGMVYGLDGTNNGFSGPFKGASLYVPTPVPVVSAGGSITNGGGVTVLSGGASAALVGRYGGGASATETTNPFNVGDFIGYSLPDFVGYLLRRPCN